MRLNDLLTVKDAAALKEVPEGTVRARIARGVLPAVKKADVWLLRRRDVEAWVVQRKRPGSGIKGGASASAGGGGGVAAAA